MEIILPAHFNSFKAWVSKNTVNHIIVDSKKITIMDEPIRINRYGLKFISEWKEYFIFKNKVHFTDEMKYQLISRVVPTLENFSEVIKQLKWHKHPEIRDYTSDEIRETWKDSFNYIEENPDEWRNWLRLPQIWAIHSIIWHLRMPLESGIIVLPTGTWKTETMLSVLVAERCEKLLVIVPSDSLREQISHKFVTLWLLKEFNIVNSSVINPRVWIVYGGFKNNADLLSFMNESNVIVWTMAAFDKFNDSQKAILSEKISLLYIDEAHHIRANSWNIFKNTFEPKKILQFTATPFRNDWKRLEWKTLFNFPLSEAQAQGYFKKIDFQPISEWDSQKADKAIAEKAIEELSKNPKHILMARCETKKRAEEIFEIYKDYGVYSPVLIHSQIKHKKEVFWRITSKKHRIIVCVDMLGEWFDLPELKIAAFHDIRKSLPITLQLVWRFTRNKFDEELWNATFIANTANLDVRKELEDLYARDADWNQILSDISYWRNLDEEKHKKFMSGFKKLSDAKIPFQNIKLKLSTVVYKTNAKEWAPEKFMEGIPWYAKIEDKFFDINDEEKILIFISATRNRVDWVNHKDIYQINWDILTLFWDEERWLVFVNSSNNWSLYTEFVKAVMGDDLELIRWINVFRAFHNINRIRLQNVWLRQYIWKWIRFRSMFGWDVWEWLSKIEKEKGEKAYAMWYGYEEWNKTTVWASIKGRVWAMRENEISVFKEWCIKTGMKLIDETIDPNQILTDTLVPEQITEIPPNIIPTHIDWSEEIYDMNENRVVFCYKDLQFDLSQAEIQVWNISDTRNQISFFVVYEDEKIELSISLFVRTIERQDNKELEEFADYKVSLIGKEKLEIILGSRIYNIEDYFQEFPPIIWFADGSALSNGNDYIVLPNIWLFDKDAIEAWDWDWVSIKDEAQWVEPLVTNSIQYHVIHKLIAEGDYDIIYDDDNSWEMADIVTIKKNEKYLKIELYHLKYASEGKVTNSIKNFYEVCGQAEKSVQWKHRKGSEFISHLLRRLIKKWNSHTRSRLEHGTEGELNKFLHMLKNEMPIDIEVIIIQPWASKNSITDDILSLLGVTQNYLKEVWNVNLRVIMSE